MRHAGGRARRNSYVACSFGPTLNAGEFVPSRRQGGASLKREIKGETLSDFGSQLFAAIDFFSGEG
jgi:hypothetical protein